MKLSVLTMLLWLVVALCVDFGSAFVKTVSQPGVDEPRSGGGGGNSNCKDGVCVNVEAISGIDSSGCISSRYDFEYTFFPDNGVVYKDATVRVSFQLDCGRKDKCQVEIDGHQCASCEVCDTPSSVRVDCTNLDNGKDIHACTDITKSIFLPFDPTPVDHPSDGCEHGVCAKVTASSSIGPNGCIQETYNYEYSFLPKSNGVEFKDATLEVDFFRDCGGPDECLVYVDDQLCESCSICDDATTVNADCSNLNRGINTNRCTDITVPYYLPFEPQRINPDRPDKPTKPPSKDPLICEDGVCADVTVTSSIDPQGCIFTTANYAYTFDPIFGVRFEKAVVSVRANLDCRGGDRCVVEVNGEECLSCQVCDRNPLAVTANCRNVKGGIRVNECSPFIGEFFLPLSPIPK